MKIGSLCSGMGGLDMAVEQFYGAEIAWVSEIDPGACAILQHHWPGVPNIGDMTTVDWNAVKPVDIICGGTPCQDLSHAGKRQGMRTGTRSNLWVSMREAIAVIRPRLVIWENVYGALSAAADCELEPEQGSLGERAGRPLLRALGRVLGDLAELGFDAEWTTLRASDIGAPHRRTRVFLIAYPASVNAARTQPARDQRGQSQAATGDGGRVATDTTSDGRREGWTESAGQLGGSDAAQRGDGAASDPDSSRVRIQPITQPRGNDSPVAWGPYEPAIRRWERTLGRLAPAPTEASTRGTQRLSPAFVEWMMGLPEGHVTGVPGLTRNNQLKALGNGVVPQQAYAALQILNYRRETEAA